MKKFLNKLETLKTVAPDHLKVEKKLRPRLNYMGYIMFFFTACSLGFAIITPQEVPIGPESESLAGPDEELIDLNPREIFNFYIVSLIFAAVGSSCFLISWRKKKNL